MSQEFPRYRLTAPFFGPDLQLYDEGFEIEFDGVPNEQMQPLNDAARAKYEAFIRGMPNGATEPLEKIVEKAMMKRNDSLGSEEIKTILESIKGMITPQHPENEPVIAPTMPSERPLMANDPRARAAMAKSQKTKISQKATAEDYAKQKLAATKRSIANKIAST
jgi:hypothetical protein